MPTARPMMPSSDRLVSNTRSSPNCFCSPSVTRWTPPLRPDVLAEHDDLRIHLELARERAAHRLGEANEVAFRRRLVGAAERRALLVAQPAHRVGIRLARGSA